LVATRAGLTLTMQSSAQRWIRPLTCRLFAAMLLGGDAAAIRAGCEGARLPSRVTLRARGMAALAFVEVESNQVQMPRATMAVPPAEATRELVVPARSGEGGFFAPSELLTLEPARPAGAPPVIRPRDWAPVASALEVENNSPHEVLLFVDDAAVGWLAAGRSATFSGVQAGRHAVRARTVDGQWRSVVMSVNVPGRWLVVPAPAATERR
jgi:hypothetical protein